MCIHSLAGGDALSTDSDLDGYDMWSHITSSDSSSSSSPRDEIVYRLPRSGPNWVFNTDSPMPSNESAVIRMGRYKMIVTTPMEAAFLPIPGNYTYLAMTYCYYDFFDLFGSEDTCGWANFLFDVLADPYEDDNLWHRDDYKEVRDTMIARIWELLHNDDFQYSMEQYYMVEYSNTPEADKIFWRAIESYDMWIGPFECEVLE